MGTTDDRIQVFRDSLLLSLGALCFLVFLGGFVLRWWGVPIAYTDLAPLLAISGILLGVKFSGDLT